MNVPRLRSDHEKVQDLIARSRGLVTLVRTVGDPPRQYVLNFKCRGVARLTAQGPIYRDEHTVEILLGPDYPFDEPGVEIKTPIFHPHVWANNKVCLGDWVGTEFLDLLVVRLFRIIQYDPDLIDPTSPANVAALRWAESMEGRLPIGTVVPGDGSPPARPKIRFTPTT